MKTRHNNNPILKNAGVVAISMFTTRLIGAAKSFFLAKYLGPSDYGIWVTAMIVTVLANIGHLGVLEAIVKEVSSFRGRKEHEKIRDVECTALAGVIVFSICFGLICFVCIWVLPGIHSFQQKLPFQLAIAASVVSFFTLFYTQRLASHELFIKVSIVESIKYSGIAVIVTILALKYGVVGATGGLLAGELIGFISAFIANSKSFHYKLIPHFDYSGIWALVRVGFPITFVWWLLLFHTAIDRIVAITMLGKEATGYYGFGVTLTTLVLLVPTAFGRVLYPRIGKAVASEGSAVALKNLVIAPTRYMSMCTAALLCVICMGYPVIYKYITPQYWPGLPSAMILVVAVYFPTLTRNGANYLIATGKLNAFIKISLFSLIFNTVFNVLFVFLGYGLTGLAYATAFSELILNVFIWYKVISDRDCEPIKVVTELFYLTLPGLLLLTLIPIIFHVLHVQSIESNVFIVAGSIGSCAILIIGLLYLLIPRYREDASGILTVLKGGLLGFKKKLPQKTVCSDDMQ